jgi:hypothetical protein
MRNVLICTGLTLALGCAPKEEPAAPGTNKCTADFTLDFTDADGSTETVEMGFCGGIDIDAGFEFGDDAHLRYVGVAMQARSGGNCYVALVIDPYCGEDELTGRPYLIDGPTGWGAKTTLVLNDCPGLPEGANTSWTLDEGELDIAVGFKHPGDGPGKTIRVAPVGTIEGSGVVDTLSLSVTGEFNIDRRSTAGEVEESICD